MCLAIPGKVIEIYEENGLKMGKLDYAGTVNVACLEYVPEIKIGQYAMVHAGFAISIVDEEEAQRTYAVWDELVQAAAEEGTDIFGMPFEDEPPKPEDKK
ncbi:MAG: HypC/HybG/HupF family hydrogenase formation chaperone [candidate division KSB1 bacterium]|nr:HypC/HybG/HupF family hydrogenase formation chaperone [candidate division KSB1 bacterium]MDQ7063582.1 HypC/HybG/HupF family hydrogenase formation chaperone [candidate division KSB1 bacterium]